MANQIFRMKESDENYSQVKMGKIEVCSSVIGVMVAGKKGFNLLDALENHAATADCLTENLWYSQFPYEGGAVQIETTFNQGELKTFVEDIGPRRISR